VSKVAALALALLLGDRPGLPSVPALLTAASSRPKPFDRLRDKRAHVVFRRTSRAPNSADSAKGMQFLRESQACIIAATRDDEVAAFACKGQRGRASIPVRHQ